MIPDSAPPSPITPSPRPDLGVRPLSARSVLLTALLGTNPPRLRASKLVTMAGLLGVGEAEALTTLAAMTAAGDVTLENGRYRLSARLAQRQRRQEHVRTDPRQPWNGRWSMAVLNPGEPADDPSLGTELTALHFGEWRPGVWLRPDNLGTRYAPALHRRCTTWTADLPGALDGRTLVRQLWDLDTWAARAVALIEAFPRSLDLGDRFLLAVTATVQLLRDPLLPDGLSPAGWPAGALRKDFDILATELEAELALFLRG